MECRRVTENDQIARGPACGEEKERRCAEMLSISKPKPTQAVSNKIWLTQQRAVRVETLPQFSDRLNANAPPGLAPAAKPLRVSLADYAAGGQYV